MISGSRMRLFWFSIPPIWATTWPFAAPILSLGIPTLVGLNMADDLRSRGGDLDTDALSEQVGAPVALISARRGEGMDAVGKFLNGKFVPPPPRQLPVIQDIPACRQWAGRLGSQAGYRPPAPAVWTHRLDAVFLHPWRVLSCLDSSWWLFFRRFSTWAEPLMDGVDSLIGASGAWIASMLAPFVVSVAAD